MRPASLWARALLWAPLLGALGCDAVGRRQLTLVPAASVAAPVAEREPEEILASGDFSLRNGDPAQALARYQSALERDPGDPRIRYRIGAALTALGLGPAAAVEFEWVLAHARAELEERALARGWLVATGRLAPVRPSPAATGEERATREGHAELSGSTSLRVRDPTRPASRLQILLITADAAGGERRYLTKIPLNSAYAISGIVPGEYRLIAQVGMMRLWDLRVSLPAPGPTRLDLTEANATSSPEAWTQL